MKHWIYALALAVSGLLSGTSWAQTGPTDCVAAFVDAKMVVDEYSPRGQCRLPDTTTGELAVYTVDLSPTASIPQEKIDFQVGIRDKATGTITMFSRKKYRQVPVQTVLAKCQKGDRIVLMAVGKQYALPHNEILVL
ncbi:MAG: hypothetical protein EAZ91_04705 [Cytophagales bacterium]|nr:MAG: hypothetical protein EAZ91_04705 [Cytophagales bacterium]